MRDRMTDALQRRKPLILCVEDDQASLFLRQRVLEQNGYSVISARTSAEALGFIRRFQVSLVISDHMLGGTTGSDLAAAIKKTRGNPPVMLYAGAAPERMGGVSCFLRKDESVEVFLAKVRDLIKRYQG